MYDKVVMSFSCLLLVGYFGQSCTLSSAKIPDAAAPLYEMVVNAYTITVRTVMLLGTISCLLIA